MILPTSAKRVLFVAALTGLSFYAGVLWRGEGHPKDRGAAAPEARIARLKTELQSLRRQNQALQAGRQALLAAAQPADPADERDDLFAEQPAPSEAENLAWAREAIWSENINEKMRAIETLIRLSPSEAVDALRLIMSQAADEQDISLVASSLHYLANNQYLLNADLKQFYNSGNEQLQRAAAGTLAQRGDDSLQQRYIDEQYVIAAQDTDPKRRAEAVQKLIAFGKNPHAASRIRSLLEDPDSFVRLKAATALAYAGDESDIPALQPLLNDHVAAIRQRAEEAMGVLTRNTGSGLILIPPPRMAADGLSE